jgi:hypothetical protein
MKKIIKIIFLIIALAVLLAGGYYSYQLYVIPKLTKLDVPMLAYPRQSVTYRYYIQASVLNATFGSRTMPAQQVTTELEKDMRAIKTAGFDGIKLSYNFKANNYLANRIALSASEQGLYPIGLLQGHQAKPKNRAFNPEEMTEWQNYVREEASANKNIIYFWEIWNEPVVDLFTYGTPEEYVELLKNTYSIIKKENPSAKIIVNLDTHDPSSAEFSNKAMELGAGNYFDVLSVHPYAANPYIREDVVKNSIAGEIELAAKYGNRWPIVIGEIGQPTSEVSEAKQARLAEFVYNQAAKNNLPVTWYYWSDERIPKNNESMGGGRDWGLIRADSTERPILSVIKKFLK